MSDAQVTREGLENVRPGREARIWSASNGGRRGEGPVDHPRSSYYGNSIINPPVWEELDIAGYLFLGGLAGASSILAAGGDLTRRPTLARRSRLCASAAIAGSLTALIHDLGRPARFINMMRVVKPTSPMSIGTWILAAYSPLNFATSASDLTGIARPVGRAAGLGAAALGPAVASYTAALIANTAVPAWHGAHREMPFLFAGSAASAGAGFGLLAAPLAENAPAQRMAMAGAVAELAAEQLMERRLGMVAESMRTGTAGKRLKAAKALTALGAVGAATLGRRNRVGAALSGAALVAGSAVTRFGIFAAGMASATDPKYTVEPQRARLDATR
ncbi:MAG TPA: NrfD/PsrC family molybdoenzyme membrane anchor subunit [Solirubrobacteraceae bacterium]|nr:NrfD/PsrC family molybdoenzyme membrane anchor subunit [Solirubrobacteraceae bacterium]